MGSEISLTIVGSNPHFYSGFQISTLEFNNLLKSNKVERLAKVFFEYDGDELDKLGVLYSFLPRSTDMNWTPYMSMIKNGKASNGVYTIIDNKMIIYASEDDIKIMKFKKLPEPNIKFKQVKPVNVAYNKSVVHAYGESPEFDDFIKYGAKLKKGSVVKWFNDEDEIIFFI